MHLANGPIINYIVLAMVTGALLLASVYHSVLFIYNRLRLIGHYTIYLWSVCIYCMIRCIYVQGVPSPSYFPTDEILQMVSFALYIRFSKVAMELDPVKDRMAYRFCKISPAIITVYIIAYTIVLHMFMTHKPVNTLFALVYLGIRVFLLFVGFISLVAVIKKRKNVYFRFIFYGILSIIIIGLAATVVEVTIKFNPYVSALTILAVGYNIDLFFFSAAISYKMRAETIEKESANRRVLEQELEIQKNRMENLVISFKVKEEERSRIATELHDEIGSTISSISILSDVITKEQNPTSVRAMQQEIKDNSKLIMEKMDDIIWSLNPRNDSMEKMLMRIRQFATPLFEAKNINYHYEIQEEVYDIVLPTEQRQQAYLIIKESINNLVKHSGCNTAVVAAKIIDSCLLFSVTDNGAGFETGNEFEGNGLHNMGQRAKTMGADLIFRSLPGVETSMTLKIKIVQTSDRMNGNDSSILPQ